MTENKGQTISIIIAILGFGLMFAILIVASTQLVTISLQDVESSLLVSTWNCIANVSKLHNTSIIDLENCLNNSIVKLNSWFKLRRINIEIENLTYTQDYNYLYSEVNYTIKFMGKPIERYIVDTYLVFKVIDFEEMFNPMTSVYVCRYLVKEVLKDIEVESYEVHGLEGIVRRVNGTLIEVVVTTPSKCPSVVELVDVRGIHVKVKVRT